MKDILLLSLLVLFVSCNKLIEEVQQLKVTEITYSDYRYDIDSKNRRGYVDMENNPMTGHFVVLRDSIKVEEFQLKDGFLNGVHRSFNEDEVMEWERYYVNNVKHGSHKEFYPNGSIKTDVTFKDGRRERDFIAYDMLRFE